jgi:hypothetical protein
MPTKSKVGYGIGLALSTIGAAASTYALTLKDAEAPTRGWIQLGGAAASAAGAFATSLAAIPGPGGLVIGVISALTSAIPGLIAGLNDLTHKTELQLKAAREVTTQRKEEATLANYEVKNLTTTISKVEKLAEAKHESAEAYQEWLDYVNQIVD